MVHVLWEWLLGFEDALWGMYVNLKVVAWWCFWGGAQGVAVAEPRSLIIKQLTLGRIAHPSIG